MHMAAYGFIHVYESINDSMFLFGGLNGSSTCKLTV